MVEPTIRIRLISDTTFGRGDGVAGLVNQEIEHDPQTGLPFVKGRTIKGLIVEECANILYAVEQSQSSALPTLMTAAKALFGQPGSTAEDRGVLSVGRAALPEDLQAFVRYQIAQKKQTPQAILEAMTTIRAQTAVNPQTDTPQDNTLRAMRVLLRETVLVAPLLLSRDLEPDEIALLSTCVASVRRAGQSRSRGRGRIEMQLQGFEEDLQNHFAALVRGETR